MLWLLLAGVVWCATFDRATRSQAQAFASQQMYRAARGLPVATIAEGFRPRVRRAAARSTVWAAAVALAGLAGLAAAWHRDARARVSTRQDG